MELIRPIMNSNFDYNSIKFISVTTCVVYYVITCHSSAIYVTIKDVKKIKINIIMLHLIFRPKLWVSFAIYTIEYNIFRTYRVAQKVSRKLYQYTLPSSFADYFTLNNIMYN